MNVEIYSFVFAHIDRLSSQSIRSQVESSHSLCLFVRLFSCVKLKSAVMENWLQSQSITGGPRERANEKTFWNNQLVFRSFSFGELTTLLIARKNERKTNNINKVKDLNVREKLASIRSLEQVDVKLTIAILSQGIIVSQLSLDSLINNVLYVR